MSKQCNARLIFQLNRAERKPRPRWFNWKGHHLTKSKDTKCWQLRRKLVTGATNNVPLLLKSEKQHTYAH